jgi:hypothetical protein
MLGSRHTFLLSSLEAIYLTLKMILKRSCTSLFIVKYRPNFWVKFFLILRSVFCLLKFSLNRNFFSIEEKQWWAKEFTVAKNCFETLSAERKAQDSFVVRAFSLIYCLRRTATHAMYYILGRHSTKSDNAGTRLHIWKPRQTKATPL